MLGGFAVLCGFLVRDILRQNHNSEMSKFNANGTQDKSYYVPAWIELRNWNVSQGEDSLTHLPNVYDPASTECFPSIYYDRSVFENQGNFTAGNTVDASAKLNSSIQLIMNSFGSYLGPSLSWRHLTCNLRGFSEKRRTNQREWNGQLISFI